MEQLLGPVTRNRNGRNINAKSDAVAIFAQPGSPIGQPISAHFIIGPVWAPDRNFLLAGFNSEHFYPLCASTDRTTLKREMAGEMWNFSGSYYNAQIKFDSLRYRILPYMYSNAWKVTNQGYTIMRALPFKFTSVTARDQTTEYMFGSAFLVAPITTSGATSRSVYLPSGETWYDFSARLTPPEGQA